MQPIIIGGGLSGLALAWYWKQRGIRALVIEARERVGGRIHTVRQQGEAGGIEMGATWLGLKHTALTELLRALNIPVTEQFLGEAAIYEPISTSPPQLVQLPHNPEPSYRISGGSDNLIQKIVQQLDPKQIILGEIVKSVSLEGENIRVQTDLQHHESNLVVCTLPPNLWKQTIHFSPELPQNLLQLAEQTHTWMGESIKIGLTYPKPFWRAANSGSTIFSNVGPVSEFYDHSYPDRQFFALKGFLNSAYQVTTASERKSVVLSQLSRYYGQQVHDYLEYIETVWSQEQFTYVPYPDPVLPHQNNGNQLFRQAHWGGKLFFGGSETAAWFPGYMDGAVRSAQEISRINP